MSIRNTPSARPESNKTKSVEVNAEKLVAVRRILAADSDSQAIDWALAFVIASEEMELTIDQTFGSLP